MRLNPGFGLGIVVRARVDFDWDRRKTDYLNELYSQTKLRHEKAQLEAIDFMSETMSVYRKLWSDKFKKFLQTSDPTHLGEFSNMTPKQYKDIIETMLKLTGQEGTKKSEIVGQVTHEHKVTEVQSVQPKALAPSDHSSLLAILDAEFKKE